MPVPDPVLYPPFNIVRLSHVEYTVTNLAASRAFYVDTLGLQVTHEEPGRLYLRAMEERGHHCIALVEAGEAKLTKGDIKTARRYFSTAPYLDRTWFEYSVIDTWRRAAEG